MKRIMDFSVNATLSRSCKWAGRRRLAKMMSAEDLQLYSQTSLEVRIPRASIDTYVAWGPLLDKSPKLLLSFGCVLEVQGGCQRA